MLDLSIGFTTGTSSWINERNHRALAPRSGQAMRTGTATAARRGQAQCMMRDVGGARLQAAWAWQAFGWRLCRRVPGTPLATAGVVASLAGAACGSAQTSRGAAGRLKSYNLADFGRLPQCTTQGRARLGHELRAFLTRLWH
ncbi:hypothetical protein PSAB6_110212 [Paraburkholderia sabiae]|nr:hypothetical protein PSAB6_110212 [Paraburkholderia sabiae]